MAIMLVKNVKEVMKGEYKRKCLQVANAIEIKGERKILTEEYLLGLARRRSSVNFGRTISME